MTREEKINKTVNSIKQVTFGRVDAEWIDAFKEGMRVALEAEEIEQSLRTCESCKYYDDIYCTNQKVDEMMDEFQQLDNYIRVDKGFGCNKHEAIQ